MLEYFTQKGNTLQPEHDHAKEVTEYRHPLYQLNRRIRELYVQ